ncbi:uncharacterized protein LOC114642557 [Erpetoichthys calabaricus]|uniref:uncharacterized protein LOC114642557 n=1 Tax=Erpetoichthys calabaricus TaxID=27687 RepID=UPI0022342802|nr:uncharacterized protein LOC114642557 [Erpetoichthys calabaricus]
MSDIRATYAAVNTFNKREGKTLLQEAGDLDMVYSELNKKKKKKSAENKKPDQFDIIYSDVSTSTNSKVGKASKSKLPAKSKEEKKKSVKTDQVDVVYSDVNTSKKTKEEKSSKKKLLAKSKEEKDKSIETDQVGVLYSGINTSEKTEEGKSTKKNFFGKSKEEKKKSIKTDHVDDVYSDVNTSEKTKEEKSTKKKLFGKSGDEKKKSVKGGKNESDVLYSDLLNLKSKKIKHSAQESPDTSKTIETKDKVAKEKSKKKNAQSKDDTGPKETKANKSTNKTEDKDKTKSEKQYVSGRHQAGFPRRCSKKCLIIICTTLLISVTLLTLIIFISQQSKNPTSPGEDGNTIYSPGNQMTGSELNNHAGDFAAHPTTTAPGNQMTSSELNNHAGDFAAHPTTTANMKEQWLNHNGKSYYFSTTKLSWDNANTSCRKQHSNLTVIKTTEELNFILNHTVGQMWVGLRKENEKWNWIDGTAFQINIFKEGIQQLKAGLDCVNIMKTGLFVSPCRTRYHWICEKIILQK